MAELEVIMPRLSDTMEEGLLTRWLKNAGDSVTRGEELAEIETDKVTVALEAEGEGFLVETFVAAGTSVAPGTVLGLIGSSRERRLPEATAEPTRVGPNRPLRATPLARKLAGRAGLGLETVGRGSGPEGRILRHDVERALSERTADPVGVTSIQRVTAQRLTRSKQEIPHYYLDADVDMTDVLRLKADLVELDEPLDVSLTTLIVRAVALALRDVPEVNSVWKNDTIERRSSVEIGLAVALDDDWVVVPVVRGADGGTLRELGTTVRSLAERARALQLVPAETGGASFSVTSLGMDGVDSFHAIINPPESGILAVGTICERPAVHDGKLCVREIGRLSLSADHRIYSGRTAARFLSTIKRRLEHPLLLLGDV
jgi:pyruvate dehydrogenase E2 component (dihydrolipoamide acetyltransferase)